MTNPRLHVLTNSEVTDFRRCRAFWGYRYAEGLRAVMPAAPLSFGTFYHKLVAAGWRGAWRVEQATVEWRAAEAIRESLVAAGEHLIAKRAELERLRPENLGELHAELEEHYRIATWAAGHYFRKFALDLRKVPLAIEAPFDVPIQTRVGVGGILRQQGVIDLVLWDPETGTLEIQDHKTTRDGPDVLGPRLPLDTQMSGYVRALQLLLNRDTRESLAFWATAPAAAQKVGWVEHQEEIRRAQTGLVTFNVVRRAVPHTPKVNRLKLIRSAAVLDTPIARLLREQEADGNPRGLVSVAQCDTLPAVYEAALLEQERERHQARTEEQGAFLAALGQRPDTYVTQLEFYRGPAELERWRREMWVEARQLRAADRDPLLRTRNPHACTAPASPKCVYSAVCLEPDSPVARAEFRVASERHEEVAEAHGGQRASGNGTERQGHGTVIGPGPDDPF